MLTRDGVPEGRRISPRCQSRCLVDAVHTLLVVFLECPAVSLAVALPMTVLADNLCVRVRCGVLLLPLVVALALALSFALALLAFALLDGANVHWRWLDHSGFRGP